MSQKNRRALAVASVIAALFLALPAPSQAAGLWSWEPVDLVSRVWFWLENLGWLPHKGETTPAQPAGRWEKDGCGINPDGTPRCSATPPAITNSEEGTGLNPDGTR
jgi:hypothetical protein